MICFGKFSYPKWILPWVKSSTPGEIAGWARAEFIPQETNDLTRDCTLLDTPSNDTRMLVGYTAISSAFTPASLAFTNHPGRFP